MECPTLFRSLQIRIKVRIRLPLDGIVPLSLNGQVSGVFFCVGLSLGGFGLQYTVLKRYCQAFFEIFSLKWKNKRFYIFRLHEKFINIKSQFLNLDVLATVLHITILFLNPENTGN